MFVEDYIYHASTRGEQLTQLYCNHSVPMGDFGDGIYLSDDIELSWIWGASTGNTCPCLNTFEISSQLSDLQGYVVDSNNDESLLFWATSIAYPRRTRDYLSQFQQEIERLYNIYVVPHLSSYHWIVSNRSDDGTSYFLPDFFGGSVSIEAIRSVYNYLSFGSQLVLKTQQAEDCLTPVSQEFYDGKPFIGTYEDWVINNARQYQESFRNSFTIGYGHEGLSCYDF